MSSQRDPENDEKLRRAFGSLKREDERAAPPIDAMLERARARPPRHAPRTVSFARISVALTPVAAAAAVALLWAVNRSPEKRAEAPAAAAAPVSTPAMHTTLPPLELDFLLQMPVSASLSALPDFDSDPLAQRRVP